MTRTRPDTDARPDSDTAGLRPLGEDRVEIGRAHV